MAGETLRAKWVVPIGQPPIDGGCVTIVDDQIATVGRRPSGVVRDLGDVAILPGFVNCHTHLDLPTLEGLPALPWDFVDWLRRVIAARRSLDPGAVQQIVQKNVDQLFASGTTLVGDIATTGESITALRATGLSALVFREVLGLKPERYEPLWTAAESDLANAEANLSVGLSPHAAYSTAAEVYRRAAVANVPLATHWLESRHERRLLEFGDGPLAEFLRAIDAVPPGADLRRADPFADLLRATERGWLLVHGNQLSDAEINRLAGAPFRDRLRGVVYCPRTYAAFGGGDHPCGKLVARGIPVALGTDSLASNPSLSVFDEARFVFGQPQSPAPAELFDMLTTIGARLLGCADNAGSLSAGRRADVAVLRPQAWTAEPLADLLAQTTAVVGTMVGGWWKLGDGG